MIANLSLTGASLAISYGGGGGPPNFPMGGPTKCLKGTRKPQPLSFIFIRESLGESRPVYREGGGGYEARATPRNPKFT